MTYINDINDNKLFYLRHKTISIQKVNNTNFKHTHTPSLTHTLTHTHAHFLARNATCRHTIISVSPKRPTSKGHR